jgi:hypothetical protein
VARVLQGRRAAAAPGSHGVAVCPRFARGAAGSSENNRGARVRGQAAARHLCRVQQRALRRRPLQNQAKWMGSVDLFLCIAAVSCALQLRLGFHARCGFDAYSCALACKLPSCSPGHAGVCSWPDGEKYEGEWHDGVPNGLGSTVLPAGDRFHGEWRHGARDGFGKLDCEFLQYRGGFEAGLFSRFGRMMSGADGESRYDGSFRKGKKWGWGHAQFPTAWYRGFFRDDALHGPCTEAVLVEGTWYECDSRYRNGKLLWRRLVDNKKAGNPSDVLAREEQRKKLFFGHPPTVSILCVKLGEDRTYIGQTVEGKADGLGIESVELEDGTCELYAGRFCDGARHGYGVVLRGVGDFYIGSFEDGLPHGVGFDLSQDMYYAGEMQVSARKAIVKTAFSNHTQPWEIE